MLKNLKIIPNPKKIQKILSMTIHNFHKNLQMKSRLIKIFQKVAMYLISMILKSIYFQVHQQKQIPVPLLIPQKQTRKKFQMYMILNHKLT